MAGPKELSLIDLLTERTRKGKLNWKTTAEEGVFLIDLDKEIEGSAKYIYDAVHLNTSGSAVVADHIARSIASKYSHLYTVR